MRIALLILGIGVMIFVLAIPAITTHTSCGPKSETVSLIKQLQNACDQYMTEYGEFPPSENHRLVPVLLGNNPRKIVFMEIYPKHLSKNKEALDEWGVPLRITYRDDNLVIIESSGSDGLFGTEDDVNTLK